MALDVKIIIDIMKPIGSVGFGYPLILVENAAEAKEYTVVANLEKLVEAGYANTSAVYKAVQLMFAQTHAPEKIAVCSATTAADAWLSVESNVSKDWRQLIVVNEGETETDVAKVMTVIEGQKTYPKMYFANLDFDDATKLTVTDVERTVLFYYTPTEDVPVPVAALVGEVAGLEVGSYTLNNLVVKGIEPLELSQEDIDKLHEKGGITCVLSAGDAVMSEGITAGGSYVDDVDGNDWIRQQLEYKTQKVFNNNLKVPYTNAGIAMLESAAVEVMTEAQNRTIVDTFEVNYLLREDTTAEDRAARRYIGGTITYSMAGAIHEIDIYCKCTL